MRHYWVDRITDLEVGVRATGVKAVALSEDEFEAHFPGDPVLPGIYLIEGAGSNGWCAFEPAVGERPNCIRPPHLSSGRPRQLHSCCIPPVLGAGDEHVAGTMSGVR
jgi:hypothetical protein